MSLHYNPARPDPSMVAAHLWGRLRASGTSVDFNTVADVARDVLLEDDWRSKSDPSVREGYVPFNRAMSSVGVELVKRGIVTWTETRPLRNVPAVRYAMGKGVVEMASTTRHAIEDIEVKLNIAGEGQTRSGADLKLIRQYAQQARRFFDSATTTADERLKVFRVRLAKDLAGKALVEFAASRILRGKVVLVVGDKATDPRLAEGSDFKTALEGMYDSGQYTHLVIDKKQYGDLLPALLDRLGISPVLREKLDSYAIEFVNGRQTGFYASGPQRKQESPVIIGRSLR